MDTLTQDVLHALRQVRRRPVFAIVAALSLAIGGGAPGGGVALGVGDAADWRASWYVVWVP